MKSRPLPYPSPSRRNKHCRRPRNTVRGRAARTTSLWVLLELRARRGMSTRFGHPLSSKPPHVQSWYTAYRRIFCETQTNNPENSLPPFTKVQTLPLYADRMRTRTWKAPRTSSSMLKNKIKIGESPHTPSFRAALQPLCIPSSLYSSSPAMTHEIIFCSAYTRQPSARPSLFPPHSPPTLS